jgi:glycosyltransferase involved in cell wall biosynthesis
VDAARRLSAAGRDVQCLIAGEFDISNPSSIDPGTLEEWRDDGAVEWLGFVADMPALLRDVDLVVLPSYREGLPKALVEAAACERPLITTDVPGCREVVTDGVEGLRVPTRCPGALADAIARLQDAPATRRAMGKAGRVRALEQFSQRAVLEQTFDLYAELVPAFCQRRPAMVD